MYNNADWELRTRVKRFVTYLFTYENGRKGKNVGFIRTDVRGEQLILEVHVQGIGRFSGEGTVYLLVEKELLLGIPVGELAMSQGRGVGRFVYDNGYPFDEFAGAAVRFGQQYYAASSWTDEVPEKLATGVFPIWGQAETETDDVPESGDADAADEESYRKKPVETMPEEASESGGADAADEELYPKTSEEAVPEEERGTAAKNVPEEVLETSAVSPHEERFLQENSAGAKEQREEDAAPLYRRIDISDIRALPKKNWYLCSNSFLIHGFFNYHYLILMETGENAGKKTYLGVPGIYERPERMMAMLFGFPDFLPDNQTMSGKREQSGNPWPKTEAADGAEEPTGKFGYWLCLLDM
jgi:hypothetical protein